MRFLTSNFKCLMAIISIFIFPDTILNSDTIWNNYYNPWNADGIYVSPHMQTCSNGSFAITGHYMIEDFVVNIYNSKGQNIKKYKASNNALCAKMTLDIFQH